jgi:hypothetical protein
MMSREEIKKKNLKDGTTTANKLSLKSDLGTWTTSIF